MGDYGELLLCSIILLRFIDVAVHISSLVLFILELVFHCICISLFVGQFTYILVASSFIIKLV